MSALKLWYTRSMYKVAGPYAWVNANRWIRNQMFYILIMIPLSHPLSETVHLMFSSPESSGSQVELTVYACSGVRRRCRQQCLSIFFEPALPIKAKLYVAPPREGGTKFI